MKKKKGEEKSQAPRKRQKKKGGPGGGTSSWEPCKKNLVKKNFPTLIPGQGVEKFRAVRVP